jgi:hypothetical protein
MALNVVAAGQHPDPYPIILLELVLSDAFVRRGVTGPDDHEESEPLCSPGSTAGGERLQGERKAEVLLERLTEENRVPKKGPFSLGSPPPL